MSDDFDALFDRFQRSAFRFEGLPCYSVPGEVDRISAWRAGRARPERSVRTSAWLRRIATTTASGKQWTRVRAVDEPIPEYLRYELNGYLENQAAGDHTLMIDRRDAPRCDDFWLFDSGTDSACAAQMHYEDSGAFRGFEMITDGSALADLTEIARRGTATGTPLNEWLATRGFGIG